VFPSDLHAEVVSGAGERLISLRVFHLPPLPRVHPPTLCFPTLRHYKSRAAAIVLVASTWLAVSIDLSVDRVETDKQLALR
jgi:hypothetical protein